MCERNVTSSPFWVVWIKTKLSEKSREKDGLNARASGLASRPKRPREAPLRAAALASRALRDLQDQRRFVAKVQRALAEAIERGEPLQPVRLRERIKGAKHRTALG